MREISSNARGLRGALTNPTELARRKGNIRKSYPVKFAGRRYKDAETAYKTLKPAYKNAEHYALMVEIMTAKLEQYPALVKALTRKGGSAWIMSCTHQPKPSADRWTTKGKNWFIKALNEAYAINMWRYWRNQSR